MRSFVTRLFPTPSFLRVATIGLDLSNQMLRLVELSQQSEGLLPNRIVELAIPAGVIERGRVVDQKLLTQFLKEVKRKHGIKYARISIPEQQVYSVTLSLDLSARSNLRSAIELVIEDNIPLRISETVFDFEILAVTDKNIFVQVVAMASTSASLLFDALTDAGLFPRSFELEGQAIARAILPKNCQGSCMIVDFGAHRTSITVATNGTVVFSSTIDFGGTHLTEQVAKKIAVSIEEAQKQIKEYGLIDRIGHVELFEGLVAGLSVLKDEINRHFIYWHDKRQFPELLPSVTNIYMVGGYSNLAGLNDYLSSFLKIPVTQANPWGNCFSFEDYIPNLQKDVAMSYITAIGLSLADFNYD